MNATSESVTQAATSGGHSDAQAGRARATHYILIRETCIFVKQALFFMAQRGLEQDWGGEYRPVCVDVEGIGGIEAARALGEAIRGGSDAWPLSVAELKSAGVDPREFVQLMHVRATHGAQRTANASHGATLREHLPRRRGIEDLEGAADELIGHLVAVGDAGAICTLCQRGTVAGVLGHAGSCAVSRLYGAIAEVGERAAEERTFAQFQALNALRSVEKFHPLGAWLPGGWPLAICGEAGELANLAKKVLRGDFSLGDKRGEMLKELADIICYSDLMISALGARTDDVLYAKFREVSGRVGFDTEAALEELRDADPCESCGLPAATFDTPEGGVPLCISCAKHRVGGNLDVDVELEEEAGDAATHRALKAVAHLGAVETA